MKKILTLLLLVALGYSQSRGESGYKLWLEYPRLTDPALLGSYQKALKQIIFPSGSDILSAAKEELNKGLSGMLDLSAPYTGSFSHTGTLIVGTPKNLAFLNLPASGTNLKSTGAEGFSIHTISAGQKKAILILGASDAGVLYGVFSFLKLLQTRQDISTISITESPAISYRLLNHWDNLDRTVERGYAGFSLWDWQRLPGYIDQRYKDYARANASVGINGTVLTNVNANALVITSEYLQKVAAIAGVFRAYNIKVYLTARFSAPIEIGGLKTADPLDPEVRQWWKNKAEEIYKYIPDFGGFLVKANSEGQPGPQSYGRNHADGANMLADAVAPYGGIVMWRAFVYDNNVPDDRAKQAYNEFKPLDGQFRKNVMVQVKNGPIDFQPREPFHPLFGAMPQTPLQMEFQLTQEYLGFATHLVYLAPLFKECLDSDTYSNGKGSTVAKIVEGALEKHVLSGIAGVANIGNDINWTGHPFAQANWYAFGRLAWNPEASSENIADDWLRMTFSNDRSFINPVKAMMMSSREAVVNYMTPLGLHHIMGWDHHYGPGPWIKDKARADWTSVYYHKADTLGIGFDRTQTGSKALNQYFPPVNKGFSNADTCPEEYLLWFHHVSWDHKMNSGRSLWNELCYRYNKGVQDVQKMQETWTALESKIDKERFRQVSSLLSIQLEEAEWWRDACLLYFKQFSRKPLPDGFPAPSHSLEYYQNLKFNFVPGI